MKVKTCQLCEQIGHEIHQCAGFGLNCINRFPDPELIHKNKLIHIASTHIVKLKIPKVSSKYKSHQCSLCYMYMHDKNECAYNIYNFIQDKPCPLKIKLLEDRQERIVEKIFECVECPICYEPLQKCDKIILRCGHQFCVTCFITNYNESENGNECSLCRESIL